MKLWRWILLLSPGVLAGAEPGEEPVIVLDLRRAIEMAVSNNFEIQASELGPKIAQARQKSASGKFDPTLEVSYTRDENLQELRTLNSELEVPSPAPGNPDPEIFARRSGNLADASITGLNASDLRVFTLNAHGLHFYFAPYAVGCYAEGAYEVAVPLEVFQNVLRKDTAVVSVFERR